MINNRKYGKRATDAEPFTSALANAIGKKGHELPAVPALLQDPVLITYDNSETEDRNAIVQNVFKG